VVKHGATIFDQKGQASISVFGLSCDAGGCLIGGGDSQTIEYSAPGDATNYLLGK